jgi:uncharacterized Zn finger protein (UPF0148 family)
MVEIQYCPNCREPLKRGISVCPICQYKFVSKKTEESISNISPISTIADVENISPTKQCPFCKGDIDASALKCRFCGEWVQPAQNRPGEKSIERGTANARAVTKGLKEKEAHDILFNIGGFIILCLSAGGWAIHPAIGIIVFIVLAGIAGHFYYKE